MAKRVTILCSVTVPAAPADVQSYLTRPHAARRFRPIVTPLPVAARLSDLEAEARQRLQVEPAGPDATRVHVALPLARGDHQALAADRVVRLLSLIRWDVRRIIAARQVGAVGVMGVVGGRQPRMVLTGSSGGIGRQVIAFFEGLGWRVDRLVRRQALQQGETFSERYWDAATTIDAEILEGADAVVHLAGRSILKWRWTQDERQDFRNSRVNSTLLLARAVARCKRPPKVLLCASGIHIYGDRGDEVLLDTAGPGTGLLADLTRDWEQASQPAREGAAGVRTVLLRMPMVLDAGSGVLHGLTPSFRLGLGLILGSGRQWWPWVAMEDVLGAMLHAIATPVLRGAINVVAPHEVHAAEFSRAVARTLDRGLFARFPGPAVRAIFGAQGDAALHSIRAAPHALRSTHFGFVLPELSSALAWELATDPVKLAQTVGVTLETSSARPPANQGG